MRVLLVLFGLGASASAAVALREVHAESAHRVEISTPHRPTSTVAHEPELPSLTTRGPLPFGQVPREPVTITGEAITLNDNDSDDGVLDQVDRCPDAPENNEGFEDVDGCPDVGGEITIVPTVEVYDGPAPPRRVIRLDLNQIIE
jgi:hypothetical protein